MPNVPAYFNCWNFNIENIRECLNIINMCVWLISYKLRLSHMGSDVGQIFLTAS